MPGLELPLPTPGVHPHHAAVILASIQSNPHAPMDFLFHAHSGFRYLVFLVGLIALIVMIYALVTRKAVGATRGLMAAFVGVVDVQVLLGVILVFMWPFYGALIGHIVMMVLAAVAAHVASVFAKRSANLQNAVAIRIGGVVAALLIIVFGIQAIGRSIF